MMEYLHRTASRLRASTAVFARDEGGSATVWNLLWLLVFGIFAGLAIDSTDARRVHTMLQSTADVASLASVQDLPNPYDKVPYDKTPGAYSNLENTAINYAGKNMKYVNHGSYMQNDDVYVGNWNEGTRTFTWGENFPEVDPPSVDAVRVHLGRNDENQNNVRTTLLSLSGIEDWEINTTATAQVTIPDCLEDGFIAEEKICIASNNTFKMDSCLHGEKGLNFKNGNVYIGDVDASHGHNASNNVSQSNIENGLDVIGYRDLTAPIVDEVFDIAWGIVSGNPTYLKYNRTAGALAKNAAEADANGNYSMKVWQITDPNITGNVGNQQTWWQSSSDVELAYNGSMADLAALLGISQAGGGQTGPGPFGCQGGMSAGTMYTQQQITAGMNKKPAMTFETTPAVDSANLAKNRIYYHEGGPSQTLEISNTLEDVVIITTAKVSIASNAKLHRSTIISLYGGGGQGINVGQNAKIGVADDCLEGGGSMVIALGSIEGASGAEFHGSVVAAGGNLGFAAQTAGFYGIAAYAKGNVFFPSNGTFGNGANDCKADVTVEDEDLIYKLVD